MLRKTVSVFLILLFLVISMAMFFVLAFSNTFLSSTFYQGKVREGTYSFLVNVAVDRIRQSDDLIASRFTEAELRTEIMNVFNQDLFNGMSQSFGEQIQKLQQNPRQPLTLSLKTLRDSLLTVANDLSYSIFKSLPVCEGDQVPQETDQGLVTCAPQGVEYNSVSGPLSSRFEKAIYSAVPEQVQYDLNATDAEGNNLLVALVQWSSTVRYTLFFILLFIIVSIALLIYSPFSDILKYEGIAFASSGIFGYLMSFGIEQLPNLAFSRIALADQHVQVQQFLVYLFSFLSLQIQQISVVFLAFGGVLILMQVFLKRR